MKKQSSILITGGAGYIGSVLTHKLVELGYNVRVLDSLIFGKDGIIDLVSSNSIDLIHADVRDERVVLKALDGIDMVMHLAGIVGDPLCRKIPEALKKANKNQDILFEIFQLRKKFWILPTTIDTTAGYLFIEPGRINIIFEKINEDYQGYDYDEPRSVAGNSSEGVYSGKYKISKGWVILTSKSWN